MHDKDRQCTVLYVTFLNSSRQTKQFVTKTKQQKTIEKTSMIAKFGITRAVIAFEITITGMLSVKRELSSKCISQMDVS